MCSSTCQGLKFVMLRKVFLRSLLCLESFLNSHASSPYGRNYPPPPPPLPPPPPSPPNQKKNVKTFEIRKNQKTRFGQNSSSWKTLRNPANTSEFVQRNKNKAFRKRTNGQMCCNYQYFGLLHPQQCKKRRKILTGNWKRINNILFIHIFILSSILLHSRYYKDYYKLQPQTKLAPAPTSIASPR